MARLSDSDLRNLLGDNYAEVQAKVEEELRTAVSPEEKRAKLARDIAKNRDTRFTAMAVLLTGILIAWSGWARADYNLDLVSGIGLAVVVGAGAWVIWLFSRGRSFQARLASPERY